MYYYGPTRISNMRIISGLYKGRRFTPPASLKARPSSDFAREGLFNVLANNVDIEDAQVLDLFVGSGSISFEFLSRGASLVTGVELNQQHILFVKKVADQLANKNLRILKTDVFRYIGTSSQTFDIIFADPPYDLPQVGMLPDLIMRSSLLRKEGLFIFDHGKSSLFTNHPNYEETRSYGNVHFSFFRHSSEEPV